MARSRKSPSGVAGGPQPGQEFRIIVNPVASVIDPEPPRDLIDPFLQYQETRFDEGGPRGYQETDGACRLWEFDVKRRIGFPTGLVPRLVHVLRGNGYRVVIEEQRQLKELAVDEEFLGAMPPDSRQLVESVRREPMGQIQVRGLNRVVEAVSHVCRMYPQASILIPVGSRSLAKTIHDKLSAMVEFPVSHQWSYERVRSLICLYGPLQHFKTGQWDLVLLPDARSATQNDASETLIGFTGRTEVERIYSFVSPGWSPGRRAQLRLEALSGPLIYQCEPARVGLRTLFLKTPSCPAPTATSTLEFKRQAYWQNNRRNDFVAGVARAFAKHDVEKLRGYGVPFRGDQPAVRNGAFADIVLVVESTEHGRELRTRLPGWELLDAVPKMEDRAANATGTPGTPPGTIMTVVKAAQTEFSADVVIRADGGTELLSLRDFPPKVTTEGNQKILLVDFDDRFCERTAQDAEHRRTRYERYGWLV